MLAAERSQMFSRRAVAELSPTVGLHLNVVSVSLLHKPYVVHLKKTKNRYRTRLKKLVLQLERWSELTRDSFFVYADPKIFSRQKTNNKTDTSASSELQTGHRSFPISTILHKTSILILSSSSTIQCFIFLFLFSF